MASTIWGETPVAAAVLRPGARVDQEALKTRVNEHVGKMQRLTGLRIIAGLPRSDIGKVLKRRLAQSYGQA